MTVEDVIQKYMANGVPRAAAENLVNNMKPFMSLEQIAANADAQAAQQKEPAASVAEEQAAPIAESPYAKNYSWQVTPDGSGIEITGLPNESVYRGAEPNVRIPEQIDGLPVTVIGEGAFCNLENKGIKSVTMPDSVKTIGNDAFSNCENLAGINIPGSVSAIGKEAFSGCKSLESVTIPDSVTVIGEGAFESCESLGGILIIPGRVKTIGKDTFKGCKLTEVIIESGVTAIGEEAFAENNLANLTLPDSLVSIGKQAFYKNELTEVIIPNSVTDIGVETFGKNKIASLTLGSGVKTIGKQAFYQNQLEQTVIPNNVTELGEGVFNENKTLKLAAIPDSFPIEDRSPLEKMIQRTSGVKYRIVTNHTYAMLKTDPNYEPEQEVGEKLPTPEEKAKKINEWTKELRKGLPEKDCYIYQIPVKFQTQEMVDMVLNQAKKDNDIDLYMSLLRVPKKSGFVPGGVYELCVKAAADIDGKHWVSGWVEEALQYAPEEYLTGALIDTCLKGVKRYRINSKAKSSKDKVGNDISESNLISCIRFIPARLWRDELTALCVEAVSNNRCLQFIPDERKTAQMCEAAVKHDPLELKYVPDTLKTLAMCEAAAAHDLINALPLIPANIASEKISALCLERLSQNKDMGVFFGKIPKHLLTPSICVEAIKREYMYNFSRDLDKIPEGLRTAEVYFEWVKKKPTAFGHFEQVPDTYKTREMCELVMKESDYSYRCFSVVPDQYKTPEMCLAAVKAYAGNYNAVPQSMRTEELKQFAKGVSHS